MLRHKHTYTKYTRVIPTVTLRDLITDEAAYNRVAAVAASVATFSNLAHLTTAVLESAPTAVEDDPVLAAFAQDLFVSPNHCTKGLGFMRQMATDLIHQTPHYDHDNTLTNVHPSLGAFFGFLNLSEEDAILIARNPATSALERVPIPTGCMVICRRDCVHAGTFYTTTHTRIYFNWMGNIDALVQDNTFPFTPRAGSHTHPNKKNGFFFYYIL